MVEAAVQPAIMCPGERVNYECNAGNINVREDDHDLSTFWLACETDLSFESPAWPQCIDRLDCPVPDNHDPLEITVTWSTGDSLTPEFSLDYTCVRPGKKIIPSSELDNSITDNMADSLPVQCLLNGTYNLDISQYSCTKPCQSPVLPEPDIMEHDWTSMEINLEIGETFQIGCLDGRQLVSKKNFEEGRPEGFLESLTGTCSITGGLEMAVGSYTCTKGCPTPANHTNVFDWSWDESQGTDIDLEVTYQCRNPVKQIANIRDPSFGFQSSLTITCLFNGRYDRNIFDFACTDCLKRDDPPNGRLVCNSKRFEANSECSLLCHPGYIPLGQTVMTCQYETKTQDYDWNRQPDEFVCVRAVGLVIGGIAADSTYLSEVEVLAPGYDCERQAPLPDYPLEVIGASAGFIQGHNLVCGGAAMTYVDCGPHSEGSKLCDRNVDCVRTEGGSRWCTGPKIRKCYSLDLINGTWKHEVDLLKPRAYAASIVMSDGSFRLMGGVGTSAVLRSSETLQMNTKSEWKAKKGPQLPQEMMGHCLASIDSWRIIVAGK